MARIRWDKVTWTTDGRPVMYSKTLLSWRGRRVDLHKIIDTDVEHCYHSHPAKAIRIILWNGYAEELENGSRKNWIFGSIGYVLPELTHRIHKVISPCYTLWIRGKTRHKVRLVGYGQEG